MPEAPNTTLSSRGGAPLAITGMELGEGLDYRSLRQRAARYAIDNFQGKKVTARSDGQEIIIPGKGIRKAFSGKRTQEELETAVVLDRLIEHSVEHGQEPDRQGNPDIKAVHYRGVDLEIGGKPHHFQVVVKETRQGQFFYDRYIDQTKNPPAQAEGSAPKGPLPDSAPEGSSSSTIGTPAPEVNAAMTRAQPATSPAATPRALLRRVVTGHCSAEGGQ